MIGSALALNPEAVTLLVIIFADSVFEKVRENLYLRKCYFGKFWQFGGFLQHFDGESSKIYVREIRSFLSPRN